MPILGLFFSPTPGQGAICVFMCLSMCTLLSCVVVVRMSLPILPLYWALK